MCACVSLCVYKRSVYLSLNVDHFSFCSPFLTCSLWLYVSQCFLHLAFSLCITHYDLYCITTNEINDALFMFHFSWFFPSSFFSPTKFHSVSLERNKTKGWTSNNKKNPVKWIWINKYSIWQLTKIFYTINVIAPLHSARIHRKKSWFILSMSGSSWLCTFHATTHRSYSMWRLPTNKKK